MKTMLQGLLIAAAISMGVASAGTNQWTSVGPSGGSFSGVRYLGNGVAVAASLRGIYRTTDHGANWTRVAELVGSGGSYGQTIAVNPVDNAQVIVFSHEAIYCSSDRGSTLQTASDVLMRFLANSLQPRSISFSRNGSELPGLGRRTRSTAASMGASRGLRDRAEYPPARALKCRSWMPDGWGTTIQYAQYHDAPYSTTDEGLHRNRLAVPVQTWRFAVSRHVAGTLLAYGNPGQPYRSTDFGASWTPAGAAQVYAVKYDLLVPGRAYAFGSDSTFRRTDNDAGNWVIHGNLPIAVAARLRLRSH